MIKYSLLHIVRRRVEYRCYMDKVWHVPHAFRRGFLWCWFSVDAFDVAIPNLLAYWAETNFTVSALRLYLGRQQGPIAKKRIG